MKSSLPLTILRPVLPALVLVLGLLPGTAGTPPSDSPSDRRLVIGLSGGMVPARLIGTAGFRDSWSSFNLASVTESTSVSTRPNYAFAGGGFLTVFLTPHLGVQLAAGYDRAGITNASTSNTAWSWTDGRSGAGTSTWSGGGRLSRLPLSANIVLREGSGRFTVEFSGGPTYFWNEFSGEAAFAYGVTKISELPGSGGQSIAQAFDALPVRLRIPATKWRTLGADIGAGVHWRIVGGLGLEAEARYFYCPAKALSWNPVQATYAGLYSRDFPAEPFTSDDAVLLDMSGQTLGLKLEMSNLRASLGLTYSFGRRISH